MDLSSLTGGGKPSEKKKAPAMEYTAQTASPLVNGEVRLTVGEDGLHIANLFDAVSISYAEMTALELAEYTVTVRTVDDDFTFSRMGSSCRPFYDALLDAYNRKVQKSLFVQGNPILTARGDYRIIEKGAASSGSASMRVHDDCVCFLPPNLDARRIPLCFVSGIDKGDYELTLRLDTGESYTFSKLGYDTEPFAGAVEKQIRTLREQTLASVRALDPSLSAAQASEVAKIMPEGAAASLGALHTVAPSFVAALDSKISDRCAAETYREFRRLCDPAQIYAGFKKNTACSEGRMDAAGGLARMLGGVTGGGPLNALGGVFDSESPESVKAPPPDPFLLWLIAPSPGGHACAVEFAEPDAATFIYRFGGSFDAFTRQLNRALEAVGWRREVIRLTDEELLKPEHRGYRMAVQRNTALQFVRSCFVGRVIHSGAWRQRLLELWSD